MSISVTFNGKSNDLYEEIDKKANFLYLATIMLMEKVVQSWSHHWVQIWHNEENNEICIEYTDLIHPKDSIIDKKLRKFGWKWNWKNNSVIIIIPLRYIYNIKFQEKDGKNMYEFYIKTNHKICEMIWKVDKNISFSPIFLK